MENPKPRVLKDFDKLDEHIQEQIKLAFPSGFAENLIGYTDKDGKRQTALPFETDEKHYLVRMTRPQAYAIVEDDEDYDDEGNLKEDIRDDYEEKYAEVEYMNDYIDDSDNENDANDDDSDTDDFD